MATTMPRIQVSFDDKRVYNMLRQMARDEGKSAAQIVYGLVKTALDLAEDMSLGQIADTRIQSFRRDDGLSTEEILKWNRKRKKGR